MRLVKFTRISTWNNQPDPSWINPDQVRWVESGGDFTTICLDGGIGEGSGEIINVAEPVEEVVRALTADPALVREYERLSLLLDKAHGRMGLIRVEASEQSQSDENDRWLHEADRDADYVSAELEAFLTAYPQFNEPDPH